MSRPPASPQPSAAPPVQVSATGGLVGWLTREGLSLAFTTYQTHRLFVVGARPDGRLSAVERLLDRPMGLAASPERLWVATRYQIWRFDDALGGGMAGDHDRLFVPRRGHVTSELDVHDVAVDGDGEVVFVNTLYSCLARLSERHSFTPLWRPPFVSRLAPEDRCHLNGLALDDGRPRFVTSCSRSDVAAGWRDRRGGGGVLLEVPSGEVVAEGFSMPHSPRLHEGELWLFDSGRGELGRVDLASGRFEPLCFLPGYLRGLAFHGRFAVVGLSKPRDRTFHGLPLDEALAARDAEARCGIFVVDLDSGNVVHRLEMEGVVQELYDVQVLPGVRCPTALGFRSDEIRRVVTFEEDGAVVRDNLAELEEGDRGSEAAPLPRPPVAAGASRAPAAATAAPAGPPAAAGGDDRVRLQVREVTFDQLLPIADHMTFPHLARTAIGRRFQEPLLAVTAISGSDLIGLAVAERREQGRLAEVHSLAVRPDRRRQGVATALLAALESNLARRGTAVLGLSYRSTWPGSAGVARIVERRGWASPIKKAVLSRADGRVVDAPWYGERPLGRGDEIFAWEELTAVERREIVRRQQEAPWFPPNLSPFEIEERLEPVSSLGLRHGGRVVGWVITHRVADDTVQYSSFFVEPGRRHGRSFALLVEAMRRQIDAGIPYGIFLVAADNRPMQRILDKRLAPYLTHRADVLWSQKELAPPAAAPAG